MEVYTFDKSLQERLVEFKKIFSGPINPASQIKSQWSYHVELVIEPVGWQALWKIPRLTCQVFQIHYPTIVVVQVKHVNFAELSALVKIVGVQDEIHLPSKYDVPLIELYSTKNQINEALDMVDTSSCIEQLRFFYNHLWMPWDFDDDEHTDWITSHLESRLRLFFDVKRNVVNKETADIITTLTREGKDIYEKISRLETDISDEDEDEDDTNCLVDEAKACQLMKFHFRLQQIRTEMEVLENPAMRNMLQRNPDSIIPSTDNTRRESRGSKLEAYFVWLGGSLERTIDCLNRAKDHLAKDTFIKTTTYLQEALDASESGDNVIIGEGEHQIKNTGGLEEGGIIRGICDYKNIIICAKENTSGSSLLDFSGDQVIVENVSVDLGERQVGILVRKGVVKLNMCKIFASNQSIVKLGIVVLPGGKLIADNTTFAGLGTAVVVHNGGEASLKECKFEECVEGLEICDDARVHMSSCCLSDFKEYGVRLETQKYLSSTEGKVGGVELLENITEISLEGCTFKNNKKGDITLKPMLVNTLPKQDIPMEIIP